MQYIVANTVVANKAIGNAVVANIVLNRQCSSRSALSEASRLQDRRSESSSLISSQHCHQMHHHQMQCNKKCTAQNRSPHNTTIKFKPSRFQMQCNIKCTGQNSKTSRIKIERTMHNAMQTWRYTVLHCIALLLLNHNSAAVASWRKSEIGRSEAET